jgi:hypothetical protein
VVDGKTIKKELYPDYAVLEDTLARRTYDESGNYTVTPFDISISDRGLSGDQLAYVLDAGKAYVFGYEFETQSPTRLVVDRARTTKAQTAQRIVSGYGQYLKVTLGGGTSAAWSATDINGEPLVHLATSVTGEAFAGIGTARLNGIEYANPHWNAYVYDISLTSTAGLTSVKSIYLSGYTGGGQQILSITGGTAALYGDRTGLVFPVPVGSAVSAIDDVSYAITRQFPSIRFDATGFARIDLATTLASNNRIVFPNFGSMPFPDEDFMVIGPTGTVISGTASRDGIDSKIVNIYCSVGNFTGQVVSSLEAQFVSGDYAKRTKNLVTESITLSGTTAQFSYDSSINRHYLLVNGLADVQSIISVTGSSGGVTSNMTSLFTLDGRQTDYQYDWSRIYLSAGLTSTSVTGPYEVTLTRFEHTGNAVGPFTVDSYADYDTVPSYTSKSTGKRYSLRDVLDFRPTRGVMGVAFGHTPPANTTVNDDSFAYTHYLPRTDKIVATRDRNFAVIEGVSDLNAPIPPDQADAMSLYTVTLNPYTFSPSDASIRFVENKRYTMRDIGQLERRIEGIENFTTLSLLEQEAKNRPIFDSNNIEIPKKGILVDQFRGHGIGDVEDPNYNVSIDFENG